MPGRPAPHPQPERPAPVNDPALSAKSIALQLRSMSSSHGQTMLAALNGPAEILMETPGRTLLLLDEPDMALSIRSVHHLARLLQSQDPKDAGPAQVH